MTIRELLIWFVRGEGEDESDCLLTFDRTPGMHQLFDCEVELRFTPGDELFLQQLRISVR